MARSKEKVLTILRHSSSSAFLMSKPTKPAGRNPTSGCIRWSIAGFTTGGQYVVNGRSFSPAAFGFGRARLKNRNDCCWNSSSRPKSPQTLYDSFLSRVAAKESFDVTQLIGPEFHHLELELVAAAWNIAQVDFLL